MLQSPTSNAEPTQPGSLHNSAISQLEFKRGT